MARKRSAAHTKAQKAGRERDRNVCQICGSRDQVEGHHIIDHQFSGAALTDNIIASAVNTIMMSTMARLTF